MAHDTTQCEGPEFKHYRSRKGRDRIEWRFRDARGLLHTGLARTREDAERHIERIRLATECDDTTR